MLVAIAMPDNIKPMIFLYGDAGYYKTMFFVVAIQKYKTNAFLTPQIASVAVTIVNVAYSDFTKIWKNEKVI